MNIALIRRALSGALAFCCLGMLTGCGGRTPSESADSSVPQTTTSGDPPETGYTTDDYLADPSLFVPVWAGEWTPPAWLTDFEAKAACFEGKPSRLMSFAHRADDSVYYPENSIEAILSCIAMGVDVIEIDVRATKDGVLVLSHDDTLTRCTDWKFRKYTEPENFPASDKICDWTFDQIKQLHLLDGNLKATTCRMPTLEEAIRVASGKIMLLLDKFEEAAEVMGMTEAELRDTVLADMRAKYDSTPSCVKGWHFETEKWQVWGGYDPAKYEQTMTRFLSPSLANFCIEGDTLIAENDNVDVWRQMDELGYNIIMTNKPMELVKYIAETYAPQ